MKIDSIIKLGNNIQIKVGQDWFGTKIERLEDASIFYISALMSKQMTVPLEEGQIYTLNAKSEKGILELDIRFLGRESSGNIVFSKMQIVSELRQLQRRDFFRVDVMLNVSIREAVKEGEAEEQPPAYWTRTLNLSEGGMLFLASKSFPKGIILSCDIILNKFDVDVTLKDIEAKVIRSISPDANGELYKIGVNFIKISKQDKRVLAKFIMISQRAKQK